MAQKSDAELRAILDQCMGFHRDQEDPRNFMLEQISEVIDELCERGRAPNDVADMIVLICEDYHRLSQRLRNLVATLARPANTLPNIGVGNHLTTLHHHNTGGRPGFLANSGIVVTPLNPYIMGNWPSFSTNSGAARPSNFGSNRDVQANSSDIPGSASTSSGSGGGGKRPKHTPYCGKVIPVPSRPKFRLSWKEDTRDKSKWNFRCVNCNEVFRDNRAVYVHFAPCVEKLGNVNGARWYDHPSIDVAKLPKTLLEEVWI